MISRGIALKGIDLVDPDLDQPAIPLPASKDAGRVPVPRRKIGSGACAGLALLLTAGTLLIAGCASARRDTEAGLADSFEAVGRPSSPRDALMRHLPVVRRGLRKDAMVLVAPLAVRTPLGARSGPVVFQSLVAPVFNVGDGLHLEIYHVSAGEARQIYGRTIDAARRYEDRQWLPLEVPIEAGRGTEESLEIRVSGGSRGDLVGDWLALAEMRLRPVHE